MIQYNVNNSKNEITILSIKGTSYKKDMIIDAQLYLPSVLFNLLTTFSNLDQQKETYTFKIIEYSLSIPYRLFFQFNVIKDYLDKLQKAYNKRKRSYKNIITVKHSLGGGLAKLLGRIVKKQAISLSGPGINAFHSLFKYEGKSENFGITGIDLVPDLDIVPRVEISGGNFHRIICKDNPKLCHGKELSLCEVLIMCKKPKEIIDKYCKNIAGLDDERINSINESAIFD